MTEISAISVFGPFTHEENILAKPFCPKDGGPGAYGGEPLEKLAVAGARLTRPLR